MSNSTLILVIILIIIAVILYKVLKPYFIKYDTTLLFCGGVGSGKSLNSVKTAVKLYKKNHSIWTLKKWWFNFINFFRTKKNKKVFNIEEPLLYSNIPVRISKKKQSIVLKKEHLTLDLRINQKSIVFIDEISQVVNQYNWNNDIVLNNLEPFIRYFRHFIGGYLICNSQAESELVKQIRSKLNSYYWCFNFQKFLFFFYRVRILHSQISENNVSISTDFIENNTRWTYGLMPRKLYNTRAFKHIYDNVKTTDNKEWNATDLTTNYILTFDKNTKKLKDLGALD